MRGLPAAPCGGQGGVEPPTRRRADHPPDNLNATQAAPPRTPKICRTPMGGSRGDGHPILHPV